MHKLRTGLPSPASIDNIHHISGAVFSCNWHVILQHYQVSVFNNIVLGKENEVSHLVSERGGSRSPHHISLSKTGFDLVLSNSNADSRSLKHEFLFSVCSYRVWSTCPAFDWRFSQSRLAVNDLYGGFFFFFREVYFKISNKVSRVAYYGIWDVPWFADALNPLWEVEHSSPGFAFHLWSINLHLSA